MRKKIHRLLSLLLAVILITASVDSSAFAARGSSNADTVVEAAAEEASVNDTSTENVDEEDITDAETSVISDVVPDFVPGYVESPDKDDASVVAKGVSARDIKNDLVEGRETDEEYTVTNEAENALATDTAFPYSYTDEESLKTYLRDNYPLPRNQNPYGTCWAHASTALSEFYAINHGLAPEKKDVDYSELHLAYFTYNQGSPSIAGDTGDKVQCSDFLVHGGNFDYAAQTLMRRRGVAAEETAPYTTEGINSVLSNGISSELERDDVLYLENAKEISFKNSSLIKETILDNGIVGVSIYASESFYDESNNSFYCGSKYNTNHAVAIVGWDDSFPKDSFNNSTGIKPSKDGAWLVRNSWNYGENNGYTGMGLLGYYNYFWLSYDDQSLTDSAWTYEMASVEEMPDNNYFYDSQIHLNSYMVSGNKSYYSANVFKAQSGAPYEEIKAVSFSAGHIASTGTDYEISIYTGIDPDSHVPTAGTQHNDAVTKGKLYLDGKYTVDLVNPVRVAEGDYFAVVIKRNDGKSIDYEYGYTDSTMTMKVESEKGQSFWSVNGSSWSDMKDGNTDKDNFVIAALTDDADEYDTEVRVTGVSLNKVSIDLAVNMSETLTAEISPSNATNKNVTWSSSNPDVATVSDTGEVAGKTAGTADITVTTVDGEKTAVCRVTVTEADPDPIPDPDPEPDPKSDFTEIEPEPVHTDLGELKVNIKYTSSTTYDGRKHVVGVNPTTGKTIAKESSSVSADIVISEFSVKLNDEEVSGITIKSFGYKNNMYPTYDDEYGKKLMIIQPKLAYDTKTNPNLKNKSFKKALEGMLKSAIEVTIEPISLDSVTAYTKAEVKSQGLGKTDNILVWNGGKLKTSYKTITEKYRDEDDDGKMKTFTYKYYYPVKVTVPGLYYQRVFTIKGKSVVKKIKLRAGGWTIKSRTETEDGEKTTYLWAVVSGSSFDYFIEEPEEYEEKESVSPILNTVYSMKKDKYGETTEKLQSRPGYFTGSLQIETVYDYDEE